mmetsp:Transcript_103850/g.298980  ORF Transcript_103850/g.298980 Transcript_103850/m.298980 type:complete len:1078 (-) Transcript_103850:276-3509(-)
MRQAQSVGAARRASSADETRKAESTGAEDEGKRRPQSNRRTSIFGEASDKRDLTLKCITLRTEILASLKKNDKTAFIPTIAEKVAENHEEKRKETEHELKQSNTARLDEGLFHGDGAWVETLNKYYVAPSRYLVNSNWFNIMILVCIIVAGLCVGIQTYPSMEDNEFLKGLDVFILIIFALECAVKTAAEGSIPSRYYTGEDGAWNIFDESLVLISIVMAAANTGFPVSFLRLLRLLRLMKLLNKVEQLRIIIHGLVHGMQSVVYIFIVMIVIFYMFSVVAVQCFGENDPAHFGNIAISMLTLFRCATLEDWTDVMYINMYGCKNYDSGLYSQADKVSFIYTNYGTFARYDCVPDLVQARPAVSVIYFALFILISAFMMLSLFVGAVCNGMHDAVEELEEEAAQKQEELEETSKKDMQKRMSVTNKEIEERKSSIDNGEAPAMATSTAMTKAPELARGPSIDLGGDGKGNGLKMLHSLKDDEPAFERHLAFLMEEAFSASKSKRPYMEEGVTPQQYIFYANYASFIRDTDLFFGIIFATIIAAGICVGLETAMDAEDTPALYAFNVLINIVFVSEMIIKVVAEGHKPWMYFNEAWNCLDFTIVVLALIPYMVEIDNPDMLNMIMIIRLLRIQKLFNSVRKLKIIVESLLSGMHSLFFVVLILILFFYIFAILGIIMFGDNDPIHFGNLQIAFLSLFRAATCEDWTDIMYINMFGCEEYGYNEDDGECKSSSAMGWIAAFYFVLFVIIGGLVLLSLFIGIICTSMETVQAEAEEKAGSDKKIDDMAKLLEIGKACKSILHDIFMMLDKEKKGCLDFETIRPIFSKYLSSPSPRPSLCGRSTHVVGNPSATNSNDAPCADVMVLVAGDDIMDNTAVLNDEPNATELTPIPTQERPPTPVEPVESAPPADLLTVAAEDKPQASQEKEGAVTPVIEGVANGGENDRARPLEIWEIELAFLAVDADLSGLIEFDEFLFFAAFVHMIREDPSLIDDFRSGLELALDAYNTDTQEAQDPAAELTEEAIEAMNEEVIRLGPGAMKLLIEELQAENAKLRGIIHTHDGVEVAKERTDRLIKEASSL